MTTSPTVGVGILGGTGFGAGELLRLFTQHPLARVVSITSSSSAGQPIANLHPQLYGFYDNLRFSAQLDLAAFADYPHKIIFSALPHTISGATIAAHYSCWKKQAIRCMDLSGDLRIQNHQLHQLHYPDSPLLPELRSQAIYGLTELLDAQSLQNTQLIANPGCLATAAIISLMPLHTLSVEKTVTMSLATGSSGSGKDPKSTTHHPTRHANFYAYKPLYHQHEGEILETVQRISGHAIQLNFIPHSLPVSRGILCTTYLTLTANYSIDALQTLMQQTYANMPFIRWRSEASPELQNVVGTNFADVTLSKRDQTVAIMVALDNLGKGMAGQAIQTMNRWFNIPERTGLWCPSLRPL